jgi:DNA polymerase III epsilon subunit-like protein
MTVDLTACIWDLPLVFIDTETSGLPPDGRACDVAAVRFQDGVPTAKFSSLINPGCEIPEQATAIHKITDEMVKSAPTLPEVASELLRVCAGAVACAYSADFDRFMLHAEIQGEDCHAFDPRLGWVDVLVLIRHFDRFVPGSGRHKLTAACARRNIIIEGAHRAMPDAIATGFLMHRLKDKIGKVSAAQLIERCAVRRAEQEASFQEWRSRQPAREAVK